MRKIETMLTLVFFLSGVAALIYQVAWQRLLTLYYGVGSISITLIVSVYMFGLGFGALIGGFLAERVKKKIYLYFLIELLIGFFGLISLSFIQYLGEYTAGSSYVLSFFYMFVYLSIPTLLMGMTLPLLTKIFNEIIKDFLHTVSFLYFINTLGAAIGALVASYLIISLWGLDGAVYFAMVINFVLAGMLFFISCNYQPLKIYMNGEEQGINRDRDSIVNEKNAYILVFITGFLAIGYEIVWFRMIGILVKDSPYAFSSILSVYLIGIAVGSFGMKKLLDKYKAIDRSQLFFALQFLIGFFVILSVTGYYFLTKYTYLGAFTRTSFFIELHPPFMVPDTSSFKNFLKDMYAYLDIFFWPFLFIFIPTLLMGASFPLISYLALSRDNEDGKTVGKVYFFNILGNVFGGIVTGFILLAYLGTEITILMFSIIGMGFGFFIISRNNYLKMHTNKFVLALLTVIIISAFLSPKRGDLYRVMHFPPGGGFETYIEEGRDGVIVTYRDNMKIWNYINGTLHGIRPVYMFFYEVVEAISFARRLENVLVIGYGAGSTTEAVLRSNRVRNLTLVEINEALIKNLKKIPIFQDMLADKRVRLVVDDGRRFLLSTEEKFDLILIDPLRSTTAYSNNLYSKEFYEIIKEHLTPGGVFMVWMDEYNVMPNTVIKSFDYVKTYSIFCLASNLPLERNNEQREHLLNNFSLEERLAIEGWDKRERMHLFDLARFKIDTEGYPINRDMKPVSEYYLGLEIRELFLR